MVETTVSVGTVAAQPRRFSEDWLASAISLVVFALALAPSPASTRCLGWPRLSQRRLLSRAIQTRMSSRETVVILIAGPGALLRDIRSWRRSCHLKLTIIIDIIFKQAETPTKGESDVRSDPIRPRSRAGAH